MIKYLILLLAFLVTFCDNSPSVGGDKTESGNFMKGNVVDINNKPIVDELAILFKEKKQTIFSPIDSTVLDSLGNYSFYIDEDGSYVVKISLNDSLYTVSDTIDIELSDNLIDSTIITNQSISVSIDSTNLTLTQKEDSTHVDDSIPTPEETLDSSEVTIAATATTPGLFIDPRDGKRYTTIMIGQDEWMTQNLAYQKISNIGMTIATDEYHPRYNWTNDNGDTLLTSYTNGYYYYKDADILFDTDTSQTQQQQVGDQRIAPEGWHISTIEDWKNIARTFGVTADEDTSTMFTYTGLAKHLKSAKGWGDSTYTDSIGFSAFPSGRIVQVNNSPNAARDYAFFPAITSDTAHYYSSTLNRGVIFSRTNEKVIILDFSSEYFTIRCVKNRE